MVNYIAKWRCSSFFIIPQRSRNHLFKRSAARKYCVTSQKLLLGRFCFSNFVYVVFFVYFSPLIWTKKCHVSYTSSSNLEKKLRHSFPQRKAESFLIKTNDADSMSSSVLAYDGMILSGKMPESIRNEIESDLSRRINEFFLTAEYNTFNNSKCQPSSRSTDDFFSFTHFYFFNFISKFSQLASRNLEHCY